MRDDDITITLSTGLVIILTTGRQFYMNPGDKIKVCKVSNSIFRIVTYHSGGSYANLDPIGALIHGCDLFNRQQYEPAIFRATVYYGNGHQEKYLLNFFEYTKMRFLFENKLPYRIECNVDGDMYNMIINMDQVQRVIFLEVGKIFDKTYTEHKKEFERDGFIIL